jgi:very-short-patch-repair endonuclease
VYRSSTLEGEWTLERGIPITSAPRTLLDVARWCSDRALARAVREAIRLEKTGLAEIGELLGRHQGRRATRRVALVLSRYSGLPLQRARSGAEVRALEVLRDANRTLPRLNVPIAGEEADLSWARERVIVEIDGSPYHLDVGEDARKEATWRAAGWKVRRLPSDDVYDHPARLLSLAPRPNVPRTTP